MKKQLAQDITQMFIEQLAQGQVPWKKPWSSMGAVPHNYHSRRSYRGINALILGLVSQRFGYQSPAWTTYKAASARGAFVRKGEKATHVVFWKPIKIEDKKTGEEKSTVMARMYSVFNTDQVDGIDWQMPEREPVEVRDAIKQVVDGYPNPPSITHSVSDQAYYMPAQDRISLPLLEQFKDEQAYAETIFHELVHSTGHTSRLDRLNGIASCRGTYAKEELVAEIGATMLMQHTGVEVDMPQMASYVGGWLKALQDDETLIIKAAQAAQKAMDHILNQSQEVE
jgi:antirestriction protein ArdC